jgi:hypothetical protein
MAWADSKGPLAGFANQRKAAANRPVDTLQVVQIGTVMM